LNPSYLSFPLYPIYSPRVSPSAVPLTSNQKRGFLAAWGGWALDGMDSFIYALVMVPALRELLPRSGIEASTANIGFYGGLMFALFLVGWGLSMLWGPIGDRFGRVRTLSLTILCYSAFTLAGAFATNIWQLAVFRLLAGIGVGGEWTLGSTFIAEEWPDERRKQGAGFMQTGYYLGILLAGLLNAVIGATYGWRVMFLIGGTPALFVAWIRRSVHEPAKWTPSNSASGSLAALFSPEYRRRTIVNCLYLLVSITGLWAGSVYVPTAVNFLATADGLGPAEAARRASYATILLSSGTILGAMVVPAIADRIGRRPTQAVFYSLMFAAIVSTFGVAFYLEEHALGWFLALLFFLGLGGANFTTYMFWLPEQYRSQCRASALGFISSVGRFAGAGITWLVGWGVSEMGTIGKPVALTSIAFLIGLALLPLGLETKGKPLPD